MKTKTNVKTLLKEHIEREKEHLAAQDVGTDAYNESLERLTKLEDQLAGLNDQSCKMILDAIKIVGGGIALPLIGLVCITATEKDTTFTGALKEYTRLFIPKK